MEMLKKIRVLQANLAIVLVLYASRAMAAPAPDLVLVSGKIFISEGQPLAEAIAIRGQRIAAVGSNADVLGLADSHTKRIDVQGHLVIPGINDAHYHHTPDPHGIELSSPPLEPTWQQILDALSVAVKTAPKGEWIYGASGITIANDPAPNRFALDHIAPDNPVVIRAYYGHGWVINSKAMSVLHIAEDEPDPLGGAFERVPGTRRLSGRVAEYAEWRVGNALAKLATEADRIKSARDLADEALSFGITSIQEMSLLPADPYVRMLREARIPLRIRVIRFPATGVHGRDLDEGRRLLAHPPGLPLVTVSGTKWILDGTPLERGAALRTPYHDQPETSGRLLFSESEIQAMVRESLTDHDPLLLHSAGDRTAEAILTALEGEGPVSEWRQRRVRMEHGDGLLPDLVPRAQRLGIVVVANPTHFSLVQPIAARYGSNTNFFPFRSLLAAGVPLAIGSDGPLNPYLNIMLATIHPIRPNEAINREQAVTAYTLGSAFAEFAENEKGTLTPGKLADLAVLSQDIFTIPTPDLPKTRSLLTMVDGKVVFATGSLPGTSVNDSFARSH